MNQRRYNQARAEKAKRAKGRKSLQGFVKYTFPKYQETPFHISLSRVLHHFTERHIRKLILTMPPQVGKTEFASRRLMPYMHGKYPELKSAVLQYNSTKARRTGREIKFIISQKPCQNVFPHLIIPDMKSSLVNTADEIQFINEGGDPGSMLLVGRKAGLAGEPLDLLNIDDPLKNASEAYSPIVRQSLHDEYDTVAEARLHNDSSQLITTTRWHESDLVGYIGASEDVIYLESWDQLENIYPDKWYMLNFQALKLSDPTEIDPRLPGEALYPERHSKAKLENTRARLTKNDPEKWNSLYMGDPRPTTGLLYSSGFKTYREMPELVDRIAVVDPADQGKDKLCAVCYGVGVDGYLYGLDFYYTAASQEITEEETAKMMKRNKINNLIIESNAGGRGFARAVKRILSEMGEPTEVITFNQNANKEARVRSNAPILMRLFMMPENWADKYPAFADALLSFRKMFNANDFDDGPDALTMAYEYSGLVMEDENMAFGIA